MLHDFNAVGQWLQSRVTGVLHTDSRQVQPGDAFIAWPGAATDGRAYVAAALAAGAAAVLMEDAGADAFLIALPAADERILRVSGLKAAAGLIAAAYYQQPSAQLRVLAVTGTNGKTSTSWWLAQALSALPGLWRMPAGMVGTLGVGRPPALPLLWGEAPADGAHTLRSTGFTTPDPVGLQGALRTFVDAGVRAIAIEASSIGIEEQRLAGLKIEVAIFTNFTQDHLDYHGSMAAYWAAKRRLFAWPGLRSAVINVDDPAGAQLARDLSQRSGRQALDVWTISQTQPARLRAFDVRYTARGMQFEVHDGDDEQTVSVPLIGSYNVSNLLGVLAAMRALDVPLSVAAQVLGLLQPVPGRMECLGGAGQPLVAVDYAHTPDALDSALQALRPMAIQRGGKLWCVFGCGGDRDASKRPLMGGIAVRQADQVVLTSDNPRSEDPAAIIAQVMSGTTGPIGGAGVTPICVVPDRAQAIATTLAQAAANDVVLLAGKGHEATQEIAGEKIPFSDAVHAAQALTRWRESPRLTLSRILPWLSGAVVVGEASITPLRVHTDSRSIAAGDLFVALRGETFDANQFLHAARDAGAVALLCQAGLDASAYPTGVARIEVADTRVALGQLAAGWRRQFDIPVIAVTGSNGKTTVTQMIASILDACAPGGAALATRGNLNNDIGVPLTLLRMAPVHRIAVVELGMNHPGEIAVLAEIAQPTVALVNNAQREHLEFMQTVEAVAQENGAVLSALPSTGVAVFPADDAYTPLWRTLAAGRRVIGFSDAPEEVQASWRNGAWQVQVRSAALQLEFTLHIAGRHNVRNALAAAQCALAAGVPVQAVVQGLQSFSAVKGRSRAVALVCGGHDLTLVDDTYNANPDSVGAAIAVLRELPGPRLLVLGDMGEVGQDGPAFHAEAGRLARAAGIEMFFCLGTLCAHAVAEFAGARHFDSMEALCAAVLEAVPGCASVLVKGSRFMRMERVVAALETPFSGASTAVPGHGE